MTGAFDIKVLTFMCGYFSEKNNQKAIPDGRLRTTARHAVFVLQLREDERDSVTLSKPQNRGYC